MSGTLEQHDGRWRLRFVRDLAHPPARVWRALTEPAHQRAWFPDSVEGDWVSGGKLTFTLATGDSFTGEVTVFDPPSVLEFSWGPDLIRLEMSERDGGSTLTLLDTFDEQGKAARDAAGWHACLDQLAAHLDGRPAPGPRRWAEVHPGYVASLGPAAATIGPPPGH
jgi:uncharacterized protein YndB with AHSA1/START domain